MVRVVTFALVLQAWIVDLLPARRTDLWREVRIFHFVLGMAISAHGSSVILQEADFQQRHVA